jgi:DNA-binding transcriptional regulator YiaG
MTPEQCRAARAWLSMSQDDLARAAGLSLSTVRDFEKGRRTPIGNNMNALRAVVEARGIKLVPNGIVGPTALAARPTLTESMDSAR